MELCRRYEVDIEHTSEGIAKGPPNSVRERVTIMPSSSPNQIPSVMEIVCALKPKRILDIGIGRGKYGLLCREYLDDIQTLDGIEVFPDYIGPVHRDLYSRLWFGRAQDLIKGLSEYDMVLLVDVIEHIPLSEVRPFITDLQSASASIIVTTPAYYRPQGPVDGNEFERHVSFISGQDLRRMGFGWVYRLDSQRIALWSRTWPRSLKGVRIRRAVHNLLPPTTYPALSGVEQALRSLVRLVPRVK